MVETIWNIIKTLLGLYVDVFKKYPLAGAILTLVCVVTYLLWSKANRKSATVPTEWWNKPAPVLIGAWLLFTPILGEGFSLFKSIWDCLAPLARLYVDFFKSYPVAAAVNTVACLIVYCLWRVWIAKRDSRPGALWKRPEIIIPAVWLLVTPLVDRVLSSDTPTSQGDTNLTINVDQPIDSGVNIGIHQGQGDINGKTYMRKPEGSGAPRPREMAPVR